MEMKPMIDMLQRIPDYGVARFRTTNDYANCDPTSRISRFAAVLVPASRPFTHSHRQASRPRRCCACATAFRL